MTTQEYWAPIPNYETYYEINKQGIVRSLHKRNYHQIIFPRKSRGQYYTIRLSIHRKTTTHYLHRLLAFTFLENPENKPIVNHRDGNIHNNDLENLEFATYSENTNHAYANGLIKKENISKAKRVIDTCANIVYPSIAAAHRLTQYSYSHFKRLIHGIVTNNTCFRLMS